MLPKAICTFNGILPKFPMIYFTQLEKVFQKIYIQSQKTLNSNSNLEKEEQSWRNHSDIKLYYKAIVIKTAWCWHKNKHIDQWNTIKSPEINPHLYSQLIFNRGSKHIQCTKDSLFNKWCWENWTDSTGK